MNEEEGMSPPKLDSSNLSVFSEENSRDSFSESWKGSDLKDIKSENSFAYESELTFGDIEEDRWDEDHVRLPCSKQCLQPQIEEESGRKILKKKWNLIKSALSLPINSGSDLVRTIFSYNLSGRWNLKGLVDFFDLELEYISKQEHDHFFGTILPNIIDLCLKLHNELKYPIKLLKRQENNSISFSQKQISVLLANAFFCTFPRRNSTGKRTEYSNFPDINFNRLFEPIETPIQAEKLKCILNYFRRRAINDSGCSYVTYTRKAISPKEFPDWEVSTVKIPKLHVDSEGVIERDGEGLLQVDFANSLIGGGVLGHGCVQEEIRFLICPELILSRLFTEKLDDNECLVIDGFEQYSDYSGYSSSFEFTDDFVDKTSMDLLKLRRNSSIVAIDALRFSHSDSSSQYSEYNIKRELNKAYVGFISNKNNPGGVATGNWGCGAFGGDPKLKSLIQLMAAGQCRRSVAYFTFGDVEFRDSLFSIYSFLLTKDIRIGQLYKTLLSYSGTSCLFKYLKSALSTSNNEKQTFKDDLQKDNLIIDINERSCIINIEPPVDKAKETPIEQSSNNHLVNFESK